MRHYKKLFEDKYLLSDMLQLRVCGWSTYSLANLYSCDRKAIEKQCEKYGAYPIDEIYSVERFIRFIPKEDKRQWFVTDGVKVCAGKNYRDYFK